MVLLGTIMIISAILFPVIVEHFNLALSNGVEIDYLIKISILFFVPYIIFIIFITVYNCFYVVVSKCQRTYFVNFHYLLDLHL